MSAKPVDSMKSVLNHEFTPATDQAVNVNVAFLSASEKKILQHSPAREVPGGMARIPKTKATTGQKSVLNTKPAVAFSDTNNPSPVTRSKGRSWGGGVSSIVF